MCNESKNTSSILLEILGAIQHSNDEIEVYLDGIDEHGIVNPFQSDAHSHELNERLGSGFFETLGIKRLVSNGYNGRMATSAFGCKFDNRITRCNWHSLKDDLEIGEVRSL